MPRMKSIINILLAKITATQIEVMLSYQSVRDIFSGSYFAAPILLVFQHFAVPLFEVFVLLR